MKINLRVNLVSGIFAVLFGIFFRIMIPYQIVTKRRLDTNAVGSDYLPKMVAVICIVIGVALIIQSLLFKKEKIVKINLRDEARVSVVAAIILAYIILMPKIGFLISSIVATALILLFLKCKKWHYYVIIATLSALVHFSFTYGLSIHLP